MQQTKSYWRMLAVGSVVSAFIASACVITTDDPDDDIDTAGSGGQATSSGGKASGGSTATGGSGTAGSAHAGSGGSGNAPGSFECDPESEAGGPSDPVGTVPLSCEPGTSPNPCDKCVQTKCCAEYGACYATEPGNQCGYGGPLKYKGEDNVGEFNCVTVCLQAAVAMSGVAPTGEDLGQCANECATSIPGSAKDCSPVYGLQTNEVVVCQVEKCSEECFGTK